MIMASDGLKRSYTDGEYRTVVHLPKEGSAYDMLVHSYCEYNAKSEIIREDELIEMGVLEWEFAKGWRIAEENLDLLVDGLVYHMLLSE